MRGIVGTAGHIDHGKTALVGALTGEQTDRLPEEQRRGISIDLGFSHLESGDLRLGIVDVPGHEDFIRNMLAGATGIDVLLLVVAADEGVMPQTREHTAIAELLGVTSAVVALTKTDLVEDDWLGLVHDDVAGFLADTPFAGAPVVPTSTITGLGIEELGQALAGAFGGARGRPDDLFRLPIDRVFTVRGTGTVVTGTVWSGRLSRDAGVRILPGGPEARVRGLQVHGGEAADVIAGERAAIALAGIDRQAVERGMSVVTGAGWEETHMITAWLRVIPGPGWSVEARQRVRIHLATAEVMARVVILEGEALGPGDEGWVQLRLETPLLARAGDRFVVRSYSPVTTIGGGVVAEPIAEKRKTLSGEARDRLKALLGGGASAVRAVLAGAGVRGVPLEAVPVLAGASPAIVEATVDGMRAVRVGSRVFPPDALDHITVELIGAVERHHDAHPLHIGADPAAVRRAAGQADAALVEHGLDLLTRRGELTMQRGRIARKGWVPRLGPAQEALRDRATAFLAEAGAAAPRVDELARSLGSPPDLPDLLELMEEQGTVVRLEHDLFMHEPAMRQLTAGVRQRLGGRSGLSPGDFREIIDVSRRHMMPILGYLDREGVTRRSGEGRAVGPA